MGDWNHQLMRGSSRWVWAVVFLVMWLPGVAWGKETIPPKPTRYFNDAAHVVSAGFAERVNRQLEDFERATSTQVVVAVYPKMESDSDIADYAIRIFNNWGVGQRGKNNGVLLLVFVQDHKLFITTGYGAEGPLPDATAKEIIDTQITPAFKAGSYEQGLQAGVNAILGAIKGEYKGTGRTVNDGRGGGGRGGGGLPVGLIVVGFLVLAAVLSRMGRNGGTGYGSNGSFTQGLILGALMNSGRRSGGSWGGGGSSWGGGGGGGGFSSGGGSSGGGGAGGSW